MTAGEPMPTNVLQGEPRCTSAPVVICGLNAQGLEADRFGGGVGAAKEKPWCPDVPWTSTALRAQGRYGPPMWPVGGASVTR